MAEKKVMIVEPAPKSTSSNLQLSDVVIEITRQCNMRCDHCLRGDPQNINISDEILDEFFRKIKGHSIGTLTLTGGEPSLVADRIKAAVKYAKKYKVYVGSFYIVTNAKQVTSAFLCSVIELFSYCSDNEISKLVYSSDQYHEKPSDINLRKLQCFSFFGAKGEIKRELVLNEGRGENINWKVLNISPYTIDEYMIDGEIYLNCKGNIVPSCDLSYESQDMPPLILGNVLDPEFDLKTCCEKWNEICENKSTTVFALQEALQERVA